MSTELPSEPFGTDLLRDYGMRSGPLNRVIVQLRFPNSTALQGDPSRIFEIARALSDDYPLFEQGNEVNFNVTPAGVVPVATSSPRWQFRSISGLDTVVITPTSLAFETTSYSSRDALLAAMRGILAASLPVIRAVYIVRIGVRYTNRIAEQATLEAIGSIFKAPLVGPSTMPLGRANLVQSFTESVFSIDEERGLGVRSGIIPAGATLDAGLAPEADPSFVLDFDAFRAGQLTAKDEDGLVLTVSDLAESAYRFFLWSLTHQGFEQFGGYEK